MNEMVIIGAGIGGLSAALALAKQGQSTTVLEQAQQLQEVGAGIQLGPNATRILIQWGLAEQLEQLACQPQLLQVNSIDGKPLAQMPFDQQFNRRYAAPYLTIHRADLQNLLLQAVEQFSSVSIKLGTKVNQLQAVADGVKLCGAENYNQLARVVIGADGLWSVARDFVSPSSVEPTEHLAWRCLIEADALANQQLLNQVTLWMGNKVHAVSYPIRQAKFLNVVIMTRGERSEYQLKQHQAWNYAASKNDLIQQVAHCCAEVQQLVAAADKWRAWVLYHRPVLYRASQYVKGNVALLGDAAHPTRPHLAQGAVMAIEDAQGLALNLAAKQPNQYSQALWHYAQLRSARNAKIQLRSQLNGNIFQLGVPFSLARNLAVKLGGAKLLDLPWLYGYNANSLSY